MIAFTEPVSGSFPFIIDKFNNIGKPTIGK